MSMSNYPLEQLAHQTIDERVANATAPKAPRGSTVRAPEQRRRKALARGLRRVADALDN